MTRRYRGLRGAVATLHGKADAIALALASMGVVLEAVPIDTDALGTFVGDVERPGAARDVVVEKARRGMAAARLPLGIATEGSFGPDPLLGFLPLHVELLAFVDDVHDQVIVLEHAGHETNWRTKAVRPGEDLSSLLAEIGLPTHAALVKPNAWPAEPGTRQAGAREAGGLDPSAPATAQRMPVAKGLRDVSDVAAAVERIAAASSDGLARVEADLRAHMNPTRMRVIAALGERLRDRLATPCPACGVPGFGRVDAEPGLPCELCGAPTDLVRAEIHGCGACAYRVARPRVDGRRSADAGHCAECNP
jgi:hypothetical protein